MGLGRARSLELMPPSLIGLTDTEIFSFLLKLRLAGLYRSFSVFVGPFLSFLSLILSGVYKYTSVVGPFGEFPFLSFHCAFFSAFSFLAFSFCHTKVVLLEEEVRYCFHGILHCLTGQGRYLMMDLKKMWSCVWMVVRTDGSIDVSGS
ncbi:hypothetical protein QBC37DRAFT_106104 [Rhypophila decipiens]|uniref:Uncharacterized protein n=1 Tax=Rhypophila decipiens TaxID=261697 RepID=A0AAN6YBJ2_9PEZI|nr:hypothetical protein QBC37DRAFT_106104 [Rhypophila decipiens]